jgi:hypothetical protein
MTHIRTAAAGLAFFVALTAGAQPAATPPAPAAGPKAAAAAEAKPAKKEKGGFIFSLLPKSLQKNPRLDFNIITEMTPAGRKLRVPTPQQPEYYLGHAGKMVNTGVGAESPKGPSAEQLQRMMTKALADGGYLVGDEAAHRPNIVVVYNWGSSSFQPPADVSDENGEGNVPVPESELRKTLLERANLLGGAKFVREVSDAMVQVDQKASMQKSFATPEGGDFMGSVGDMMPDPFERLRARSPEMERLVEELFSSSFFIVASAYDYAAMAKNQRLLLWRTKMTVNSLGVNMTESMPALIASAAPYLGRETKEPVVVTKRISRDGRVEIGEIVEVKPDVPAPPAKK